MALLLTEPTGGLLQIQRPLSLGLGFGLELVAAREPRHLLAICYIAPAPMELAVYTQMTVGATGWVAHGSDLAW